MTTQAEAIANSAEKWDPVKHPRGRDGKYIETNSFVQVFSGPGGEQIASGRVTAAHKGGDGRVWVGIDTGGGKTVWYRPKQIQTVSVKAHIPGTPTPKDVEGDELPLAPLPGIDSKPESVVWDDVEAFDPYNTDNETLTQLYGWDEKVGGWAEWIANNPWADDSEVWIAKDGSAIYVVDESGDVDVVDPVTLEVTKQIHGMEIDDDVENGLIVKVHSPDLDEPDPDSGWSPTPEALWNHPGDWDHWLKEMGVDSEHAEVYVSNEDPTHLIVTEMGGASASHFKNGFFTMGMSHPEDLEWASGPNGSFYKTYEGPLVYNAKVDAKSVAKAKADIAADDMPPVAPEDPGYVAWLEDLGLSLETEVYIDALGGYVIVPPGETTAMAFGPDGIKVTDTMSLDDVAEAAIDGKLMATWPPHAGMGNEGAEDFGELPGEPVDDWLEGHQMAGASLYNIPGQTGVYAVPHDAEPGDQAIHFPDGLLSDIVDVSSLTVEEIQDYNGIDKVWPVEQTPEDPSADGEDFGPLMEWEKELLDSIEPAPSESEPIPDLLTSNLAVKVPPSVADSLAPGSHFFSHPQGATIIVGPDGHVTKYTAAGKVASTSATSDKLFNGHGQWKHTGYVQGSWNDPKPSLYDEDPDGSLILVAAHYNGEAFVPKPKPTAKKMPMKKAASKPTPTEPQTSLNTGGTDDSILTKSHVFLGTTLGNVYIEASNGFFGKNFAHSGDNWTPMDGIPPTAQSAKYNPTTGEITADPVDPVDSGESPLVSVTVPPIVELGAVDAWVSGQGMVAWIYVSESDQVFMSVNGGPWAISPSKPANLTTQGQLPAKVEQNSLGTNVVSLAQTEESTPPVMSTPAPPAAAPIKIPAGKTPANMLAMIAVSFINKNPGSPTQAQAFAVQLSEVLESTDYDAALKQLNSLMTIAKLGGKQRARYKTLLQMHMGVTPAPGSSPQSAVTGDPGKWQPVEPSNPKAIPFTKGSKLVNGGDVNAGTAKANVQENIAKRMAGRVTLDQLTAAVLTTSFNSNSGVKDLAKVADGINKGGKPGGYFVRSGPNGTWAWQKVKPANSYFTTIPADKAGAERAMRESLVSNMVQVWAGTSNDSNARALAMQHAAEIEFGLKGIYVWPTEKAATKLEYDRHGPLFREFLRCMYENTQEWAKDNKVTHVKLRRGMNLSANKSKAAVGAAHIVELRPMSSFTTDASTASGFGSGYQIEAAVPIEWVIGTAATGFGCQSEYEWVILGGKHKMKRIA